MSGTMLAVRPNGAQTRRRSCSDSDSHVARCNVPSHSMQSKCQGRHKPHSGEAPRAHSSLSGSVHRKGIWALAPSGLPPARAWPGPPCGSATPGNRLRTTLMEQECHGRIPAGRGLDARFAPETTTSQALRRSETLLRLSPVRLCTETGSAQTRLTHPLSDPDETVRAEPKSPRRKSSCHQ